MFQHALAGAAVERHRVFDVGCRQAGTQGNPLRGDDVAQFLALGAFGFDVAFGDQPFKMPVDCADRHAQLRRQGRLGDIGVVLDLFEQDQFAGIGGGFHKEKRLKITIQPV